MKALKTPIALLSILLLLLGGYFSLKSYFSRKEDVISRTLKEMAPDEKWVLDYFFREILLREGGIYVLNGSKPAAIGDFELPGLREVVFYGGRFIKRRTLLLKGLETWRKYQHFFSSDSYALICYENKEKNLVSILLVNKKRFLSEVEKNIDDFKKVLGPEITPKILLNKAISEDRSLYQVLNDHCGLLGIILGFGKHNSWLFYQREIIWQQIDDYQFVPKKQNFIEEKLNAINEQFEPVGKKSRNNKLSFSSLPAFVFDPQLKETQVLLRDYAKQRKDLAQIYEDGNFLELALRKLASNSF